MMRHIGFCLLVSLLGLSGAHASSGIASDFQLDTRLSYGYGNTRATTVQSIFEAEPSLQLEFSQVWRAELSGRIRLDFADELEPGRTPTDNYSTLSRPVVVGDLATIELRDVFFERRLSAGILRLGKQQIVWGKLDGIKVLDVLNPQNFREFILDDFSSSRISLWSAYLDITKSGWRAEFAVIPDNTGHAIPAQDAWFELTAPRFRYGATPGDAVPRTVTLRRGISADTSAFALRLSRQFGALELGTIAYSGLDHEPLGRVSNVNSEAVVERFYERREVYGVSAETAFGSFALRAELASQPGRLFNTRTTQALDVVALDQVTIGVGLDIDGPMDTFINLQYVQDKLQDAPASLVRPAEDRILTVYLAKSFAYESMQMSVRWYRSQELGDEMASASFQYLPTDNTRLRLAFDSFSGNAAGVFGQFSNGDRITFSLEHTF